MIQTAIDKLADYCIAQGFQGYDPYDTLNSPIPFRWFGKWGPPVAIQIQKRNPYHIRPFMGIKKGINPKGAGLFLKAFCLLYRKIKNEKYLDQAKWLFNWLKQNYSKGYSGYAWGYNFDWASPGSYLKAYTPSVVVTSFVVDGIYEYYLLTGDPEAAASITSAAHYIEKDIPVTVFETGIAYSYTHLQADCCYNASLLAAEVLAKADKVAGKMRYHENIQKAANFVLSKQKPGGEWYYSMNLTSGEERKQIDFHQGFVLVSLHNLATLAGLQSPEMQTAIIKGLAYYRHYQFLENGQSLWRVPDKWPVEIHNQSQGIITFSRLQHFNPGYAAFAHQIARYTLENMQSEKGYFYYRKYAWYTNKIPFMRWAQAWMLLALAEILETDEKD